MELSSLSTVHIYPAASDILPGGQAAVHLSDRRLLSASGGLAELLGYDGGPQLCAAAEYLAGLVLPGDLPCVSKAMKQLIPVEGRVRIECRLVRRDGPPVWVTLCAGLAQGPEEPYLQCWFLDLTDLRRTERELAERCRLLTEKSRREPMTGLLNKDGFREDARAYLAEVGRQVPYALLVLDLDDFKCINDRFGHTYGDQVLQAFSAAMVDSFGPKAICGRYGGDEFMVLLRATPPEEVPAALRSFYRALRCRRKEDRPFQCSIGAVTARGGMNLGILFDLADTALYDAKRKGKNRFMVVEAPCTQ